jgi:hypothetical protein
MENTFEYNTEYVLQFRTGSFVGIIETNGDIYLNDPQNPFIKLYHSNINDGYLLKYMKIEYDTSNQKM